MPPAPLGGSKASADRPGVLPSVALMRKPFASPVVLERSASRAPLASLTIEAFTPAPARLIASRTFSSVAEPAGMVTVTGAAPALAVKPAWPVSQRPISMLRLPSPTTSADVL